MDSSRRIAPNAVPHASSQLAMTHEELLAEARRAWESAVEDWMRAVRFWEDHLLRRVLRHWKQSSVKAREEGWVGQIEAIRRKRQAFFWLLKVVRLRRAEDEWVRRKLRRALKRWASYRSVPPPTHPVHIRAAFKWLSYLLVAYEWSLPPSGASSRARIEAMGQMAGVIEEAAMAVAEGSSMAPRQAREGGADFDQGLAGVEWSGLVEGRMALSRRKVPILLQAHAILDAWVVSRLLRDWRHRTSALIGARRALDAYRCRVAFDRTLFYGRFRQRIRRLLTRQLGVRDRRKLNLAVSLWRSRTTRLSRLRRSAEHVEEDVARKRLQRAMMEWRRHWALLARSRHLLQTSLTLWRSGLLAKCLHALRRHARRQQHVRHAAATLTESRLVEDRRKVLRRWYISARRRVGARWLVTATARIEERYQTRLAFWLVKWAGDASEAAVTIQRFVRGLLCRARARRERAWAAEKAHRTEAALRQRRRTRLRRAVQIWRQASSRRREGRSRLLALLARLCKTLPVRLSLQRWQHEVRWAHRMEAAAVRAARHGRTSRLRRSLTRLADWMHRRQEHSMSMRRAEALQMVMSVLRLLRRWRNMTGSILAVRWSEQVGSLWYLGQAVRRVMGHGGLPDRPAWQELGEGLLSWRWDSDAVMEAATAWGPWERVGLRALQAGANRAAGRRAQLVLAHDGVWLEYVYAVLVAGQYADFWRRRRMLSSSLVRWYDSNSRVLRREDESRMIAMHHLARRLRETALTAMAATVVRRRRERRMAVWAARDWAVQWAGRALQRWCWWLLRRRRHHALMAVGEASLQDKRRRRGLVWWWRGRAWLLAGRQRKRLAERRHVEWLLWAGWLVLRRGAGRRAMARDSRSRAHDAYLLRWLHRWRGRWLEARQRRRVLSTSKSLFTAAQRRMRASPRVRKVRSASLYASQQQRPTVRSSLGCSSPGAFLTERLLSYSATYRAGDLPHHAASDRAAVPEAILCRIGEAWYVCRWLRGWRQICHTNHMLVSGRELAHGFHRQGQVGWALSRLFVHRREQRRQRMSMERAVDFSRRQGLRAWDPYSWQRRLAMAASAQGTSSLSASSGSHQRRTGRGSMAAPLRVVAARAMAALSFHAIKQRHGRAMSAVAQRHYLVVRFLVRWARRAASSGLAGRAMIKAEASGRRTTAAKSLMTWRRRARSRRFQSVCLTMADDLIRAHVRDAALAHWRRYAMLRRFHRSAVETLVLRRQRAVKRAVWSALQRFTRARVSRFRDMQRRLGRRWLSGALWCWRERTLTFRRQALALRLALVSHVSTKAGGALSTWRAHRRARMRLRQLARRAARSGRESKLLRCLWRWHRVSGFSRAVRSLRTRATARRALRTWREAASWQASERAISLAIRCREELSILHKAFHALSWYTSRRARLRESSQLVSGLVEQRVKHATLETWAQAAITRRRDLTLGIQVGMEHCYCLMRSALLDWHGLLLTRRAVEVRRVVVARRCMKRWQRRAFALQYARLKEDDAALHRQHLSKRRCLSWWVMGVRLMSLLRDWEERRRARRALAGLRRGVARSRRRRLLQVWRAWRALVAEERKRRLRLHVGCDRMARLLVGAVRFNRWRAITRRRQAARLLMTRTLPRLYARILLGPLKRYGDWLAGPVSVRAREVAQGSQARLLQKAFTSWGRQQRLQRYVRLFTGAGRWGHRLLAHSFRLWTLGVRLDKVARSAGAFGDRKQLRSAVVRWRGRVGRRAGLEGSSRQADKHRRSRAWRAWRSTVALAAKARAIRAEACRWEQRRWWDRWREAARWQQAEAAGDRAVLGRSVRRWSAFVTGEQEERRALRFWRSVFKGRAFVAWRDHVREKRSRAEAMRRERRVMAEVARREEGRSRRRIAAVLEAWKAYAQARGQRKGLKQRAGMWWARKAMAGALRSLHDSPGVRARRAWRMLLIARAAQALWRWRSWAARHRAVQVMLLQHHALRHWHRHTRRRIEDQHVASAVLITHRQYLLARSLYTWRASWARVLRVRLVRTRAASSHTRSALRSWLRVWHRRRAARALAATLSQALVKSTLLQWQEAVLIGRAELWRTASRGRRAVRHWRAFISAKIEWEARAALQVLGTRMLRRWRASTEQAVARRWKGRVDQARATAVQQDRSLRRALLWLRHWARRRHRLRLAAGPQRTQLAGRRLLRRWLHVAVWEGRRRREGEARAVAHYERRALRRAVGRWWRKVFLGADV